MWTSSSKIRQLVKERLNKEISTGKAEGLIQRAELMILRACQDQVVEPPFRFGPKTSNIGSRNKRAWLATPTTDGYKKNQKSQVIEMWDVNEKWVGRCIVQDDPGHVSYVFFRKEAWLLPIVAAASDHLRAVFDRVDKLRPVESYASAQNAIGKAVPRHVKNLRGLRLTVPANPVAREASPFIPVEKDFRGPSISANEAHGMKSFFYNQPDEDLCLAIDDNCWVFFTAWTKWVYIF